MHHQQTFTKGNSKGCTAIPQYPQGIGSRTQCKYQNLWMLKSHNQSSISVDSTNHRSGNTVVFVEKNPHVSGPAQFKPMLSKGQLYLKYKERHPNVHCSTVYNSQDMEAP